MNPTLEARQPASSVSERVVISVPPIFISPLSGLSMPAMRLRRVVFPDPEGPMSARNSPSSISNVMSFSTGSI
jgi:hypothetical protein